MTTPHQTIEAAFEIWMADPSNHTMDKLVQACQGLVFHYAKLYGGGYSFEDLCQSGYEGLLKGIQNFDPAIGTKFVTYASHCIIGEIRHFVRKESRYYYPNYLDGYRDKMDKMILDSLDDRDEPISADELAAKLNLQTDAILPLMGAGLVHLGNLELASIKAKDMGSFTLPIEDKLFLSQMKYRLSDVQKDVIEMLFQQEMTQEEVAKELGLSQKQVSRIKLKSLEKMKSVIKK